MTWGSRTLGCLTPLALATAAFGQVYSSSPGIAIPTTASVTAFSNSIVVAGGPASITDLNVVFRCTHTWDSDLDLVLEGPNGHICLSTDNGGSGDNYSTTRFDDEAAAVIGSTGNNTAPFNNNYKPEGLINGISFTAPATFLGTNHAAFSGFDGSDSNGTWTLYAGDNIGGDGGTWSYWSLEFNGSVDPQGPPAVGSPTNPTGTGAVGGVTSCNSVARLFTVTVVPGTFPTSSGIAVAANFSALGGSAAQAFFDDGSNGDVTAGDNVWSYSFAPPTPGTAVVMPFTITDAQARSGGGNFAAVTVTDCSNPRGTGAIAGAAACPGTPRLITVTAIGAISPPSTGMAVTANLSAAGGSATQQLFDDGSNGDVTAGDNIFSFNFTPATSGNFTGMPFTVTDAEARSGGGTLPALAVSVCSSGLPGTFIDLGALNANPVADAQSYAAGQIRWYKFSVGNVADPSSYLDIWTSAGANPGTLGDVEIGLFDNTGALINTDDDDSDGLQSAQSFGRILPNRPAIGTGLAFNGRDGALIPGTYWLAVCEFNAVFAANWSVQIATPADTGDVIANIVYFSDTQPTNPTGIGSGGVVGECGGNAVATVAVTGGLNPASTGISVSLDTTAIGGGSVAMLDNGTGGDATAGDNIFSATVSVGGGADQVFALPFTVSDAQARSSNGSLNVTRAASEVGDLPSSAKMYYGVSGNTITGSIGGGTDVDMFAICISDTANFEASTNNGGAAYDTQLFLFNADGTGAAMNDDEPDVAGTLQSHMMLNNSLLPAAPAIVLPSGGLYYLAVSPYNRDPITSGVATDTIWANQATTPAGSFDATWAPNGVTPTAAVAGWTNTGNAGGAFTITMVGGTTVCPADLSGGTAGVPDCAVDINDLLYFLTAFEAGNADVDNGSNNGVRDCATDINDLLFFLIRFEAGC